MKKVTKVILTLAPSLFVIGLVLPLTLGLQPKVDEAGEDTAVYSDEASVKDYNQPDFRLDDGEDDDEDDTTVVKPDKVKLHYYNEAGVTGSTVGSQRAFYIWVTGVDGIEISRNEFSEFYSVSEDKKMMTLDIDFSNDTFKPYAGKNSLFFIIKYEKKSASDLNWGGQSEDMQLSFKTYAPKDGLTEVWTMPSAGGGIAILDSYNKTQVHGVKQAEFTDWKTIHCVVTDNTKKVNWKLYAFDESYYKIKAKKRAEYEKWYLVKEGTGSGSAFDISLKYEAHVNVVYSLVSHDPDSDSDPDMAALDKTTTISYENLYFTEKFHKYYEDANENAALGMEYHPEGTTFRVWSPISANMSILLYDDGTSTEFADATHAGDDKARGYHMAYKSGGIWEVTITGADLKGKYYSLQVDNTLGTNITMDPYATSSGVCGVRGYIYDKNGADVTPTGWNTEFGIANDSLETPQDLSIYEVHVQDFTGDASWGGPENERGKYNGFVHEGTTLPGDASIKTGFDHLKELGVNAVQLTPVFDHDNDERPSKMKYNWGYNPLNYNIPEGGYSSDPFNGAVRVKEFRNLVLQLSKTTAKTRVIMDVVYNHVSSASASNFNKLMPRYYYRYARKDHTYTWWQDGKEYSSTVYKGSMWDGSGCNNEVATERPMMRKFIVDSLKMWATDYKIKGFRFDLMGLIDFKTLQKAQKELYKIDKSIYMYGEGWTSGGYHGEGSDEWKAENPGAEDPHNYGAFKWQVYNECNKQKVPDGVYLGSFNDTVRNQLRGENNVNGYPGKGLVQGGEVSGKSGYDLAKNVCEGLWGADVTVNTDGLCTGIHSEQTVNYASCHDNWTVFDQLYNTVADGDVTTDGDAETRAFKLVRETLQVHSMIFSSNAPAFIQGGEELLRTKELDFDPNVDTEKNVKPSDCAKLHGRWVCHNSYNTPASVNAFKWGNKKTVTITFDGHSKTFDVTDWGNSDRISGVHGLTGVFADMIKLHTDMAKKRTDTATKWDDVFRKTTHNHDIDADAWIWSGLADTYGMQVNETFIYLTLEASFPDVGIDYDGVSADVGTQNGSWTRYIKSGFMNDPFFHSAEWDDEEGHHYTEWATIKMREDHCITVYLTDWA